MATAVFFCVLSVYVRVRAALPLPWRKLPICHYCKRAPVHLASTRFQICSTSWAGEWFTNGNNGLRPSRRSQCAMAEPCVLHAPIHTPPGTSVVADVRVWLLGHLFELDGQVSWRKSPPFCKNTIYIWTVLFFGVYLRNKVVRDGRTVSDRHELYVFFGGEPDRCLAYIVWRITK